MKKIFVLAAAMLLVLAGCTKAENYEKETEESEEQTIETSAEDFTESVSENPSGTNESDESVSEASASAQPNVATTSAAGQTVTVVKGTTAAKTTAAAGTVTTKQPATTKAQQEAATTSHTTAKPAPETTKPAPTTVKPVPAITSLALVTTKPAPTTTKPATSAAPSEKLTVSVYCDCKTAVSYGIREQGSYGKIIPASGVMFNCSVSVEKGATALDALTAAAKAQGVVLNEQRGYIKSVGGLSEKACGGTSGWIYSVNGAFPSVASNQYVLKSGDTVRLLYTVKNGDVANLEWS